MSCTSCNSKQYARKVCKVCEVVNDDTRKKKCSFCELCGVWICRYHNSRNLKAMLERARAAIITKIKF